jgi:hypothetical protein
MNIHYKQNEASQHFKEVYLQNKFVGTIIFYVLEPEMPSCTVITAFMFKDLNL